jgi:phage protein D
MPVPTLYTSRPVVLLDGQQNAALSTDILTLLVEETTEGLFRCEATFNNYGEHGNNADYLYLGRDVLDFGKEFSVKVGPGDEARRVFKGRISALEAEYPPGGGPLLVVLAEDRLHDLRMTRRTRTFEDVSDQDVMQQIAQEHSLDTDISIDGPTYKVLAQVNQSDLAFLRERARCINAELWLEDKKLFAYSRTDRASNMGDPIDVSYGVNLFSFSVRADLAHQCTELGVAGWDVAAKDAIEETADQSAISAELNDGESSGGSILQAAFAERKERIVHMMPFTSEEARAFAQARYRERARCFVTGSGVADGDARIRVGTTLRIGGVGPLFNGKYYVSRVRHTYDGTYGFRTEFEVERPGLSKAAQ